LATATSLRAADSMRGIIGQATEGADVAVIRALVFMKLSQAALTRPLLQYFSSN